MVLSYKHENVIFQFKSEIELESKAVVIADGSNSPWPKVFDLGPKNLHFASTTSVRLNGRGGLQEGCARFEFGLVQNGFAWAFPLKGNVSIGVGSFIGNNICSTDEILERLLPSIGFEPDEGTRIKSSLRVWNGHSNLHANGIVVVGDAASLCDPFLAEGLRPSLMSGYEAAKSIENLIRGNSNSLSNYSESMKEKWGESMAWGR